MGLGEAHLLTRLDFGSGGFPPLFPERPIYEPERFRARQGSPLGDVPCAPVSEVRLRGFFVMASMWLGRRVGFLDDFSHRGACLALAGGHAQGSGCTVWRCRRAYVVRRAVREEQLPGVLGVVLSQASGEMKRFKNAMSGGAASALSSRIIQSGRWQIVGAPRSSMK